MESFIIIFLGAIIGSYLNVLIYRLPGDMDLEGSRSKCPQCKTVLSAFDLIPIVSWILLGARCRYCKAKISIQYPFVEISSAAFLLASYVRYGFGLEMALQYIFFAFCLVSAFTDARTQIIPDRITLPALALFVAASAFRRGTAAPFSMQIGSSDWVFQLSNALLGVVVCGGFLWILAELSGGKMGGGDIKFMAATGAYLGWYTSMMVLLLGSILGIIVTYTLIMLGKSKKGQMIPFGPYLAIAGIVLSNISLNTFF